MSQICTACQIYPAIKGHHQCQSCKNLFDYWYKKDGIDKLITKMRADALPKKKKDYNFIIGIAIIILFGISCALFFYKLIDTFIK